MARTNEKTPVRYRMRHDQVLIKKTRVERVHGLFMPEASIQGNQFIVQAVGPDVRDDLKVGDVVLMKGVRGAEYCELPNDNSLLVIADENIMLVVEPELAD